jgi:hypothetical protein
MNKSSRRITTTWPPARNTLAWTPLEQAIKTAKMAEPKHATLIGMNIGLPGTGANPPPIQNPTPNNTFHATTHPTKTLAFT